MIGHRWAPNTYHVRDLLARNQVRYQWLDLDTSEEARRLLAALGSETPRLPVLLFPDGSWLADPTPIEAAEHFGLRTQAQLPFYDLIIVGAGPAGLGAAVYGASEGLRTLLIEREAPGGDEFEDRKLPGLPGWAERGRTDSTCPHAGRALRGRTALTS